MKNNKGLPIKASGTMKKLLPTVEKAFTPLKSFTEDPTFREYWKVFNEYSGPFRKKPNPDKNWFPYYTPKDTTTSKFAGHDHALQIIPAWEDDDLLRVLNSEKRFSPEIFVFLTWCFFNGFGNYPSIEGIESYLSYYYEWFEDKEEFLKYIEYYTEELPENLKPERYSCKIIIEWIANERRRTKKTTSIKKPGAPKIPSLGLDELLGVENFNIVMDYLIMDGLVQKIENGYMFTHKARELKFNTLLGCLANYLFVRHVIKEHYKHSPTLFALAFDKTFNLRIENVASFIKAFSKGKVKNALFYYQDRFPTLADKFRKIKQQEELFSSNN